MSATGPRPIARAARQRTTVNTRRRTVAASALVWVLAAACASFGGLRPRARPLPDAQVLFVTTPAATLIRTLDSLVRARGMAVAVVTPVEGYLETRWYDLDAGTPTDEPFRRLDRIVRMRFTADPQQGRTRLVAECVVRVKWDPGLPERELERIAPEDHPGRVMMQELLQAAGALGPPPAPLDTAAARS